MKSFVPTHSKAGLLAGVFISHILFVLTVAWTPESFDVSGSGNSVFPPDEPSLDAVVRIDTVYGGRFLTVGEEENFRVMVKEGSAWPIVYEWELGDGTRSVGNNVVHKYRREGRYHLSVRVKNPYGTDSSGFWVSVFKPPDSIARVVDASGRITDENGDVREAIPARATVQTQSEAIDGSYYSWVIGTYLNRGGAEAVLGLLSDIGLEHVRIFEDASGPGSTAYRVVTGKYLSETKALRAKKDVERLVERQVSLIAIRS